MMKKVDFGWWQNQWKKHKKIEEQNISMRGAETRGLGFGKLLKDQAKTNKQTKSEWSPETNKEGKRQENKSQVRQGFANKGDDLESMLR